MTTNDTNDARTNALEKRLRVIELSLQLMEATSRSANLELLEQIKTLESRLQALEPQPEREPQLDYKND